MQLVLFKDTLEVDSKPQYGVLDDSKDNPDVICLECSSIVEYGDYVILKRLSWSDIRITEKTDKRNKYVVCIDPMYARDTLCFSSKDLSQSEFEDFDYYDTDEQPWMEIDAPPFIDIVEAETEEEACKIAIRNTEYDERIMYAIKI